MKAQNVGGSASAIVAQARQDISELASFGKTPSGGSNGNRHTLLPPMMSQKRTQASRRAAAGWHKKYDVQWLQPSAVQMLRAQAARYTQLFSPMPMPSATFDDSNNSFRPGDLLPDLASIPAPASAESDDGPDMVSLVKPGGEMISTSLGKFNVVRPVMGVEVWNLVEPADVSTRSPSPARIGSGESPPPGILRRKKKAKDGAQVKQFHENHLEPNTVLSPWTLNEEVRNSHDKDSKKSADEGPSLVTYLPVIKQRSSDLEISIRERNKMNRLMSRRYAASRKARRTVVGRLDPLDSAEEERDAFPLPIKSQEAQSDDTPRSTE